MNTSSISGDVLSSVDKKRFCVIIAQGASAIQPLRLYFLLNKCHKRCFVYKEATLSKARQNAAYSQLRKCTVNNKGYYRTDS